MTATPKLRALARLFQSLNFGHMASRLTHIADQAGDDPCAPCQPGHRQPFYDEGFTDAEIDAICELLGCLPPHEG